jgi:phosphinothricin acetyltransferase
MTIIRTLATMTILLSILLISRESIMKCAKIDYLTFMVQKGLSNRTICIVFLHLGMEIRQAQSLDLKEINEIYNQAVEERFCTAHLVPVTLEQREMWFRQHDSDRYPVYVGSERGKVTGWISLSAYRTDRQAFKHVAEVSYYVHRNLRGHGTGSRLMAHAIAMAPEFGFSVLVAILLSKNPASIGLLEKFGFTRWGNMPGIAQIDQEVADHLYYGLKL